MSKRLAADWRYICRPLNQSISKSTNQSILNDWLMNQSINQSVSQPVRQLTRVNQSICQSISRSVLSFKAFSSTGERVGKDVEFSESFEDA